MRSGDIETARGIGIEVGREARSGQLLNSLDVSEIDSFQADNRGLILGAGLADKLNVSVGDAITLVVPSLVQGAPPRPRVLNGSTYGGY